MLNLRPRHPSGAAARPPGGATIAAAPEISSATTRRLRWLVTTARAVLLFERAWRILLPVLVVAGLFVATSWTGLWLELPHWARGLGVGTFGIATGLCLLRLREFRFPTRKEALARLDRTSGLASRPAEVLDDRLANASSDPATAAIWALHRKRAEAAVAALRAGLPSPRIAEIDRYALRGLVLVALVALGFIAGAERFPRITAAFDWHLGVGARSGERIDAWIDPPSYTGKMPLVLSLAPAGPFAAKVREDRIEAPVGSVVIIRGSTRRPQVESNGGLSGAIPDDPASSSTKQAARPKPETEVRLVLRGDASLSIGPAGSRLGQFDLVAIPDKAPTISFTDVPRANARGSFGIAYEVADDYGVVGAEAALGEPSFVNGRKSKRSLVEPPRLALTLPPTGGATGEAETTADLSEHPWAGARALLTLTARDAGGNEGKSAPLEIMVPQRPFSNPLARALAEQRRNLVLAPDDKAKVETALQALAFAPEAFGTNASLYLGLVVAESRLKAALTDSDLLEVADYLWEMALRIEDGDLATAERELRAAEQALREALARNAPEEEIERFTEALRAALESFLREFAKKDQETGEIAQGPTNSRAVDPRELLSMLDTLQDMARSGNHADASRLLDRLQHILENLRSARRGKPDPRAAEMSRALDELGKLGAEEQALRDDTYRRGQEAQRRDPARSHAWDPSHPFGTMPSLDDEEPVEDSTVPGQDSAEARQGTADLAARQQGLRDRLAQIQKRLKQAGQAGTDLDGAETAMREAEAALEQGVGRSDEAVEAQGRALEALRQGAQKLAEAMQGSGDEAGSGQPEAGEEGPGGRPRYGRRGATDPLGRESGNGRLDPAGARYDPLGTPASARAQRVLQELRRRLGEPERPRDELDYLERLLRRY